LPLTPPPGADQANLATSVANWSTKPCRNFRVPFIRDGAIGIDEAGLEADIRLAAHDEHAQIAKNLPQMLLCDRRADGAGDVPVMAAGLPFQEFWP